MEIFALVLLIVLNGLFAMSEIALVTARKARLMKLSADGDSSAALALKVSEDPTRFLSTVQSKRPARPPSHCLHRPPSFAFSAGDTHGNVSVST